MSLFDVRNLDEPSLISRAGLERACGTARSAQASAPYAFELFDESDLLVLPLAGSANAAPDAGKACAEHTSGLQLFDWNANSVTSRGVVPVRGEVKRAFVYRSRLLAISDDQIASFDIANRESPKRLGQATIANTAQQAVRVGANIVALGADWYTQSPQMVVFPIDGGASVPIASIDLGATIAASSSDCWESYWSSFSASSQLFVQGTRVVVVYDGRFARRQGQVGFAVIDVGDPAHPSLLGHKVLTLGTTVASRSDYDSASARPFGCGVGHYDSPNGFFSAGQRLVHLGNTIVLQELDPSGPPSSDARKSPEARATLHAVDLSNPANIRLLSSTVISEGAPTSGLFVSRNSVLTSHIETAGTSGRVKFYLDRLELSNPLVPARSKVNVPGSLFGVDEESNHVVTIDYVRTVDTLDRTAGDSDELECGSQTAFGTAWIAYSQSGAGGRSAPEQKNCVRVDRVLTLVDLTGGTTTVLDTFSPAGEPIVDAAMGVDRLYLTHRAAGGAPSPSRGIEVLAGIRAGRWDSAATVSIPSNQSPIPSSSDARFAVPPSDSSPLLVYDTSNPAEPAKVLESDRAASARGWVYSTSLDSEYLVLALGQYGVSAMAIP